MPKENDFHVFRTHKYTINLPIELYEKAKIKARKAGIYRVSIYFRAIIERELSGETSLNMEDIIKGRKESERIASGEHRRQILNDFYKSKSLNKYQRSIAKLVELFSPKQYTLNFKKKS